jgi:nucleoside-diphosphate-sugar epimerase
MRGRVLVTGASGFIGADLVMRLSASGWQVRAAARTPRSVPHGPEIEAVPLPDLAWDVDWSGLLDGMTHAVHLAGIAHATNAIPEATYNAVNATSVLTLGEAASVSNVQRVVMMSSVRAQCGPTAAGIVDETREPAPQDAYGRAKLAGERYLAASMTGSSAQWCVLRPVVVYGPGVKGNMAQLAKLARTPWPLPVGGLKGRRSLLGLVNLAAAVEHALVSPAAVGETFLLCDPEPVTVPQMIAAMRAGRGARPGIVTAPVAPLELAAKIAGREAAWERIAGSLEVSSASLAASGWHPLETAREGLRRWTREALADSTRHGRE